MTDHELEQRIRNAVEHTTPDLLDEILSSCDQQNTMTGPSVCQAHTDGQSEGAIIEMSEKPNSRSRRIKKSLAAVAAVAAMLVVCIGGFQLFQGTTAPAADSVILLDVNPSLSLTVDAEETVLAVEALNRDAEEVLGTMELKDTSLEVAVNAIIGSMLQKGYLGDLQNAILVSVENEDAARGEALQQKVSDAITSAARNDSLDAAVLSQLLTGDNAALAELAEQYQISLGKAALIQEVIAQAPTLTFEDLAPMTINEIALIAASKNVSSASVTQSGDASDKAYLTRTEALDVVYGHAGVTAEEVVMAKVEFDSEHGVMIYEVEFETAAREGEYEINAATGEILKSELKDRNAAVPDDGAEHHDHAAGSETGVSGSTENASYIGESAALAAALQYAGVAESSLREQHVELDHDDGTVVYEVEFKTADAEYEYKVDAVSGTVLKTGHHGH